MPGLPGHILSHPACRLNKEFLWNFKECLVVKIALNGDKDCRGQHYSERHRQDGRIKIAHCLWFWAAYLCFGTHIRSLINLSQIRPFGLQVGRGVIADFRRLLHQLKNTNGLFGIHVNNENITDKVVAAGNVEFHSFFYAVR